MRIILVFNLLIFSYFGSYAQDFVLNSPDLKLSAEIEINQQGIVLKMMNWFKPILSLSRIVLVVSKMETGRWQVKNTMRNVVSEDVKPLIRHKSETYKNVFNELIFTFKSNQSLSFRLFNEGIAYRFSTATKDSLTIFKENLNILFEEDDSIRFQSQKSFRSAYEAPYEFSKLSELDSLKLCNSPILVEKQNGTFVMITESDLYNYPGLWIKSTRRSQISGINPQYPKKLTYKSNPYSNGQVGETYDYIAKVAGSRTFPWRIFAVADQEDGLINNNMVYLLASPTKMTDVSWIKPGVVMFDWWGKNNIYGVDFKAGVNTETAKYFIDFCAKKGFRYFLFDDGWSPKDDFLHTIPGLNMAEVTTYAKSKGVGVMLWVIWNSLKIVRT